MKSVVILVLSLFIVNMLAGCVESNIPEATTTVMPTPTPPAIPRATPTSEKVIDIEKINRNELGERIYTGFTPEETQKLRDVKDECPDCHHDFPYSIRIIEIEGELWWACEGLIAPKEELRKCTYVREVTDKEVLRYLS
ncbi:MAG: hypothetical protein GKB99_01970 [Methanocellales archaeon]|nr:hypothetical protein [Methanocellales archaeon]